MMKLCLISFATVTLFTLSQLSADEPKGVPQVGQPPAAAQVEVFSAGKQNLFAQAPVAPQVQGVATGKPNVEQPVGPSGAAPQLAKEKAAETGSVDDSPMGRALDGKAPASQPVGQSSAAVQRARNSDKPAEPGSVTDSPMGRALDRADARKGDAPAATAGAAEKMWAERPLGSEDRGATNAQTTKREEATTNRASYSDVAKRTNSERHDRAWYTQRYNKVVLAGTGYYYLDAGYWYPARGYDSNADTYSYDGPICAYGDLTPDRVIARVQTRLQEKGYYDGASDGVLGAGTRAAIGNFQRDNKLTPTSAIDEATVEALGLA